MRVLNICTSDSAGGAAIAAYRLHQGLKRNEVDAYYLAQKKAVDDEKVVDPLNTFTKGLQRLQMFGSIERMVAKWYTGEKTLAFSSGIISTPNILKQIRIIDPDIIHFHWVNQGFISPSLIAKFNKPLVWSMHDMWAFTGGCHYDNFCGKFQQECGACPILKSSNQKDLSNWSYRKKQKHFKDLNLTVIGLSQWIMNAAQQSNIFNRETTNFVNLPNPIDLRVFFPIEKTLAKKILNIPTDKKLILFGALNATGDTRKGFDLLAEGLKKKSFSAHTDFHILIFGASRSEHTFDFPVHFTGHVRDDVTKRIIYSAADLMVIPSRQDNLPNTAVEAMACATPVVAFDTGGLRDIVDHKVNGYLAEAFSTKELSRGIEYILHNDQIALSEAAHQKVLNDFEMDKITQKYIELYTKILNRAAVKEN